MRVNSYRFPSTGVGRITRPPLFLAFLLVAAFLFVANGRANGGVQATKPPHYSLWMCVHRQEHSSWYDSGAPYYGGLQMGQWFIDHYAHPPGYPHQWSPLTQMWVAENAFKRERYSRSWLYGQWPPSRGVCF